MPETKKQCAPLSNIALLISLFYLSFLALTTQPIIFNDAQGYYQLTQLFLKGDWINYFQTGPNREPLYPLLMTIIKSFADFCGASFFTWQLTIQMGLLVATQLLTRRILRILSLPDGWIAFAVLWIGFSPALVNSGLILYSEVLSYPLILWSIVNISQAWTKLTHPTPLSKAAATGGLTGASLLLTTMVKSSFEPIALAIFLMFTSMLIRFFFKQTQRFKTAFVLVFVMIAVYQIPILTFKSINKHFNGNFTLTSRASTALQANTLRLIEAPLTYDHISSAASYIPGLEFCEQWKLKECYYWSVPYLDLRIQQSNESLGHQSNIEEISSESMTKLAEKIIHHPLPYFLYSTMEALKLLFWEGTQTSYLTYPQSIESIYQNQNLLYILRFISALLCFASLIIGGIFILRNKYQWWKLEERNISASYILWIMIVITLYVLMMSRFYLIPRYALPIAPLFIIIITWSIHQITKNRNTKKIN